MTRTTNARLAGSTFLIYIAAGIGGLILFEQAAGSGAIADRLAAIAEHARLVRLAVVVNMLMVFCAFVLGVTLYALTCDEDRDLALLALSCRLGEGVVNAVMCIAMLGLVSVAAGLAEAAAPDVAAATALGDALVGAQDWGMNVGATVFAVGSTLFAYLFLRARTIPVWLAWLGVIASILLVVALPLQMARILTGPASYYVWIPMAVFEVLLAFWLLIKGVEPPGLHRDIP